MEHERFVEHRDDERRATRSVMQVKSEEVRVSGAEHISEPARPY
jgi:hypothetical protein